MSKELLIATYENRRLLVLNIFLTRPNKISAALAYAYEHRLAPIFHEEIAREHYGMDPYEDIYAVKADFIRAVAKHVDEHWLATNLDDVNFSKLENAFGGYKTNRMELVFAIRYMRLDGRFDDELYKAIVANAPVEARSIMDAYEADDVNFE